MRQIFNSFQSFIKSDFAIVFFANVFSYFVTFCGAILYVRLLDKYQFGLYTFSFNIVSLFLLVNGLGVASGIMQFVSSEKDLNKQSAYLQFAFIAGLLFNFIIIILIIFYALFFSIPIPEAKYILLSMALFPVGRLYIDIYQAYFRARQLNKDQARFSVINNIIILLSNLIGIYFFKVYGLIIFNYIGYLIVFIFSTKYFKLYTHFKLSNFIENYRLKVINYWKFINYSFYAITNNAFSGLLFVLDIVIISYVIKKPELVASYRVASIIPFAFSFIPSVVMTYYYPFFVKNSSDVIYIRALYRNITKKMLICTGIISIFLVLLAKPIIIIVFGKIYKDSIIPFQILSFGFWILASSRSINGNILASLGKIKHSLFITTLVLIFNSVITFILVKYFGIIGAAIGVVIIYLLSSLISYLILNLVLRNI